VGFATDIGRRRTQNQDNYSVRMDLGLFIVADGMGGHRGGEIASAMVVENVPKLVGETQLIKDWSSRSALVDAIQEANNTIFQRAMNETKLQGMGTTTTALLFRGKTLTVGHVGDSRVYYFRNNAIWQVTRDHSLVEEKLRAGLITRAEMKTDRMKNVITRSVGFESKVNVELYEMETKKGDLFLVCSDGLSGFVEDERMMEIVQEEIFAKRSQEYDLKVAVEKLIAQANENGGDDNITCVLVEVQD
jgi:PPM family protein phosphatase